MGLDVLRPSELTDVDGPIVAIVSVRFPNHPTITRVSDEDFWDDGYGPVWRYRETLGDVGFVRATSWESAFEATIDEIMFDADPDDVAETPDGDLPEGYHYRGSGIPSNPARTSDIAQEDLNGSLLDRCPDRTDDDREYFVIVETD